MTRMISILFDGHNLLFRYFWGMPQTIMSSDGRIVHGAYGFIASVLQTITKFAPVSAVVCFDSEVKSTRYDMLPTYKANRLQSFEPNDPKNPFSQLPIIKLALDHIKIPWTEVEATEADDLIGGYVDAALERNSSVIIVSTDMDFIQLVTDSVWVYTKYGKREKIYTPTVVRERFDISPIQYVDFKSLTGDKSDNITGVPGIGPKTAARLLREFGSVKNVFGHLDNLNPKLAAKLECYRDDVLLAKEIIKIHRNFPVEVDLLNQVVDFNLRETSARKVFQEMGIW